MIELILIIKLKEAYMSYCARNLNFPVILIPYDLLFLMRFSALLDYILHFGFLLLGCFLCVLVDF